MKNNNTTRNIPFTTIQDVFKKSKDRSIILFGAGNISEKTKRLLADVNIKMIVDNAINDVGEFQLGIELRNPDYLKTEDGQNSFIIICTTSFVEVSKQLEKMKFIPNKDFIVSPILNDLRIIDELETIKQKLLFTSGSPIQNSDKIGGGIYELNVDGDQWSNEKVISGNCHGMIKHDENFISVDTELGIFEFDQEYNIVRSRKLPRGIRPHGVDYSNEKKRYYIVGSCLDGVLILDDDFNIIDQIRISNKMERTGEPHHHCNDCLVVDGSLYVSMFSLTGNWKRDIFDGVVLEFDLETSTLIGPVVKDLWMPHNVKLIDGSLHVLNSLQGELLTNNSQVIGKFPAFTRGLAHDGIFYYIGQSRNRNFSKNIGLSKNISIDTGIIVFDSYTKVSRFLQLSPKISEIHSIIIID